jgi:hypothetical protein
MEQFLFRGEWVSTLLNVYIETNCKRTVAAKFTTAAWNRYYKSYRTWFRHDLILSAPDRALMNAILSDFERLVKKHRGALPYMMTTADRHQSKYAIVSVDKERRPMTIQKALINRWAPKIEDHHE